MKNDFTKGVFKENPVFVIALGLCPALAVSNTLANALGMGLSVIFVLTFSNIVVSLLRNYIPQKVRLPSSIVIISTFVTVADLILKAYFPILSKDLGIFVPLIVVNCIILGRAEAFASKNPVGASALDGAGMGAGFSLALLAIAVVREPLGTGQITLLSDLLRLASPGAADFVFWSAPVSVLALAPGALIVFGLLKALSVWWSSRKGGKA
jgi:electron transport complex protein RnfE